MRTEALLLTAQCGFLPKPAWSLNKALHADARPARAVTARSSDLSILRRPGVVSAVIIGVDGARLASELPLSLETLECRDIADICLPPGHAPEVTSLTVRQERILDPQSCRELLVRLPKLRRLRLENDLRALGSMYIMPRAVRAAVIHLPAGLEVLHTQHVPFAFVVPDGVQEFRATGSCGADLDSLPDSLTDLRIDGFAFLTPRAEAALRDASFRWPSRLVTLDMSGLDGPSRLVGLPDTLTSLTIPDACTVPFDVPPRLEVLVLGRDFDRRLRLPESLREVTFGLRFEVHHQDLPDGLVRLCVRSTSFCWTGGLPRGLRELIVDIDFDQSHGAAGAMPEGLRELDLRSANVAKYPLPPGLEVFRIDCPLWGYPVPTVPPGLLELHVGSDYVSSLPMLPAGLRLLSLPATGPTYAFRRRPELRVVYKDDEGVECPRVPPKKRKRTYGRSS